tara:strand:- start:1936 stop:2205 length:270 start_codon:yes stop_codon:yes gene_type:complete
MRLKSDVRLEGVSPEIAFVMPAIARVFADVNAELTITSIHNVGKAIDLRSRDLSKPKLQVIVHALKDALGPSFDIVVEGSHVHLEYDPK